MGAIARCVICRGNIGQSNGTHKEYCDGIIKKTIKKENNPTTYSCSTCKHEYKPIHKKPCNKCENSNKYKKDKKYPIKINQRYKK